MATTLTRPEVAERRVVLHGVSWTTYEALLADHRDRRVPHFAFDQGVLEIVSPSVRHGSSSWALARIVEVYAEATGIDFFNAGSTTLQHEDWERGFEADSTFYIQNAYRMRGKAELNPTVDPPPDLVIEIDVTSSSLNKLPIYAQFGVAEVWRSDGAGVVIYKLADGRYLESPESLALPGLSAADLSRLLGDSRTLSQTAWLRALRQWLRERKGGA